MGVAGLAAFALACFIGLAWTTATIGFPWGGLVKYHWVSLFNVGASYTMGVLIWRVWKDTPPIRVPLPFARALLPLYCAVVSFWSVWFAPLFFILVLAPLMMFGGMGARIEGEAATRWARALGDLSFPLYAVHLPLIMLVKLPGGPVIAAAIGLATLIWLRRDSWRNALAGRAQPTAP